jgi:hypothetical protein
LALGDDKSKLVGDALEIFVEAYLATQPIAHVNGTGWLVRFRFRSGVISFCLMTPRAQHSNRVEVRAHSL